MTTILQVINHYRRGSNAYQHIANDTPDVYEARALRAILSWLRSAEGEALTPHVREKIEKVANTALLDVMNRVRDANKFTPASK